MNGSAWASSARAGGAGRIRGSTYIRGTEGVIQFGLHGGIDPGIRIVPFAKGKEEIRLPWKGCGDTGKLWKNLLDCVKTRQPPACSIDIGLRVQAPLSMAILSHRENRVVQFDHEKQVIQ